MAMSTDEIVDNLSEQVDEVQALSSIFEDGWHVIDEASRRFAITLSTDSEPRKRKIVFKFHLPDEYPSTVPPQYELEAAWLRGKRRKQLDAELSEIYCANKGQIVIFQWTEKIREFLQEKPTSPEVPDVPAELDVGVLSLESPEGEVGVEEDDFNPEKAAESYLPYVKNSHAEVPEQRVTSPEIFHGETLWDRRSVFQGHLAVVNSEEEVRLVMDKLLENKKIADATHNITAYRIRRENTSIMMQNCADDGEHTAGSRLLHLLQILEAENVLIIVTRWYGGVHLGPDRFKHISNCARNMLDQHGYIKYKEDKKSGKKGKKNR